MRERFAVARLFRGGDFRLNSEKNLASEEASYNVKRATTSSIGDFGD
jgi:hypothetical protein